MPRNPTTRRLAIVSASGDDGDALGGADADGDVEGRGDPVGGGVEADELGDGVAAATQPASPAPPIASAAPRNCRRLNSGPSFTHGSIREVAGRRG
jgi:hypothetical protein